MSATKDSDELDRAISWLKHAQGQLTDSQIALAKLDEIAAYGHYTLDVIIGGRTTSQAGNGYHEVKVDLDFLGKQDAALKCYQAPLFACVRRYLERQIKHYEVNIERHRERIKRLA